jgi:hypothetical protein
MSHDDFEDVPGLPEALPAGERLVWQGTPTWQGLARRAFRMPWVAGYLAGMVTLRAAWLASEGASLQDVVSATGSSAVLSLIAVGVLAALAWLSAGATIYTITNRRVAIRHGISVGLTLNLPFSAIEGAAFKEFGDGSGQISLRLQKGARIGYLLNWPHVRPGRYTMPEPTLRAIPAVAGVAKLLADALAESAAPATIEAASMVRAAPKTVRLPNSVAA